MRSRFPIIAIATLVTVGLAAQSTEQGRIYRPGQGATDPVLLSQVSPKYTPAALAAGLAGLVQLEAVVLPDGAVGDVRVVKSLDTRLGLDEQAVEAVRQWRFRPGRLADQPVAVLVTLVVEFRQHQGQKADADEFAKGAVRPGTAGLVEPKLVRPVAPKYTSEAMRAKIEGVVVIEAVVLEDGSVGRARIKQSLDDQFGLDAKALEAVADWSFEPGTVDGTPVPVLIELRLQFRLHE